MKRVELPHPHTSQTPLSLRFAITVTWEQAELGAENENNRAEGMQAQKHVTRRVRWRAKTSAEEKPVPSPEEARDETKPMVFGVFLDVRYLKKIQKTHAKGSSTQSRQCQMWKRGAFLEW